MAISFSQINTNTRVPLFYAELDPSLAGSGVSLGGSGLLVGQRLAAGTVAAGIPTAVTSKAQAVGFFGEGSHLAHMVEAYLANDATGELVCIALDDDGAAADATGTLSFTGPATADGTIYLYVAGRRVTAAVADGDAATAIATAVAAAITAADDMPISAAANVADVDITALNGGELGNYIDLRFNYLGASGGEAFPGGVGGTVTPMSGGTTNPSMAPAIAAMGDTEYDYTAQPYTDTTSLDAWQTEMADSSAGRWGPNRQVYGHVWSADIGTQSALSTKYGDAARNDPHMSVVGMYDTPTPPWEICAAYMAQAAASLRIDPARPLQTLALSGVAAPPVASQFTAAERGILLTDGVATVYVDSASTVRIERSITTYQENALGADDDAWLDVQTPATLQLLIRELRSEIQLRYGRHKLANDGTRLAPGQAVVTPSILRGTVLAKYRDWEFRGLVENFDLFASNLIVERSTTNVNAVEALIPPDLVNQFRGFFSLWQWRLQYAVAA